MTNLPPTDRRTRRPRPADLLTPAPTRVMGVLNVTPDSFSDGGRWAHVDDALARGREMAERGARIVDVGGESTRPGSTRVDPAEELERVLPVVRGLAEEGVAISVDTLHASTARAAVEAGALIVNDVSGGLYDPEMYRTMAGTGVIYLLQHWRGTPETMNDLAVYGDVVADVCGELAARRDAALAAGVDPELLVLDPGLGFAKDAGHNWSILARLDALDALGHPVLIGASRKRFVAEVVPPALAADPRERDHATAAITMLCAQVGVWGVRVHEVGPSVDAVAVLAAVRAAGACR